MSNHWRSSFIYILMNIIVRHNSLHAGHRFVNLSFADFCQHDYFIKYYFRNKIVSNNLDQCQPDVLSNLDRSPYGLQRLSADDNACH